MDELDQREARSSVRFERSARGVITPKVCVYTSDMDPKVLDECLSEAKRVFNDALNYSEALGEKP